MERAEMIEQMADNMVENMDIATLAMYAQERLVDSYSQLTEEELRQEIQEYFPYLMEELE
jgi:hypothetical protein